MIRYAKGVDLLVHEVAGGSSASAELPCRLGEVHALGERGPAGARTQSFAGHQAWRNDGIGVPLIDCLLPPVRGLLCFPSVLMKEAPGQRGRQRRQRPLEQRRTTGGNAKAEA